MLRVRVVAVQTRYFQAFYLMQNISNTVSAINVGVNFFKPLNFATSLPLIRGVSQIMHIYVCMYVLFFQ